ncbi:VOC family protein [Novilysobacter erysipheiresistens]|uniref:VOC family protein n=1 Tax=Novilysobacter erysipheiresistens TaxID=1749332 RepID=A0ABU7YX37_9GAMM
MQLTPYLNFKGDCEAAFKLYERVLGGKILMLTRFGEAPPDAQMPGADRDQVMHVSMSIGEQMLMGSDCPAEYYQKPAGTSVSISVDDRDEGERIFKALAEGGTEQMAYSETFWAEGFGMCIDRFGTPWMVNAGSKDMSA